MTAKIEKIWRTKVGFQAFVAYDLDLGFRCGYVGVPRGHPLYEIRRGQSCPALHPAKLEENYGKRNPITLVLLMMYTDDEIITRPDFVFDVHGGITFSDFIKDDKIASDLWWFGFDCAHYNDKTAIYHGGEERTLAYVINECEALALQITTKTKCDAQH